MIPPSFFLHKVDDTSIDGTYHLFVRWMKNSNKYIIRKKSLSGSVTIFQYFTGSGESINKAWSNRGNLDYLDYCRYKAAILHSPSPWQNNCSEASCSIINHLTTKKLMQNENHINVEGIDESQVVFEIIGTTVRSIINIDTNQDGDIQLLEGLNALQTVAVKVIRQLPDIDVLKREIKDYTEGEKADLIADLSNEMEIPTAKMNAMVVRAAQIVLDAIDLVIDAGRPETDWETVTVVRA